MKKVRKAVIPAAGFGTRFLPQTKAMPKEMLPIVDKPVIQYVVEEAVAAGIEDIIIVTGSQKRNIEDHFDRPSTDLVENLRMGGEKKRPLLEEAERIGNMANFIYVRQKGPYGNGTPLLNVRHIIGDEPFLYTWSDDFIKAEPKSRFQQLIDTYNEHGASVLASIRASSDADYSRYGFAGGTEIQPGLIDAKEIIEKPGKENAPSDLATVSGFIFTPDIFEYLDKAKENLQPDHELYYNDALKLMLADGKKVLAKEIENAKYYDCGDKLSWLIANVELALERDEFNDKLREFLAGLK
jgi:UTP--glucose-1-phosphate uridylyltransferase